MWFKKKSVLQAEHHYDTEKSADGSTDLRTTWKDYHNYSNSINDSGLPSAADAGNYFYLPALGMYFYDRPGGIGVGGFTWSSSAHPRSRNHAYRLSFSRGHVNVDYGNRYDGYRVDGFE